MWGIFAFDHQHDIAHERICKNMLLVMNLCVLAVGQLARHFVYRHIVTL
jgi:hypothetical protein